jgi:hypothetical protein
MNRRSTKISPVSRKGGPVDAGPIETQVRADVDALISAHPMGESLAEMAFKLAGLLDGDDVKDLAVAGINKELRETLCELARLASGDDDLSDALSVPTTLRDPAES